MDIQQLKDRCNLKYASAIDGMEHGGNISEIAVNLLDAADTLVRISKADFLLRAECEGKAAKLLAAAKKLRIDGDVSAVYKQLTGRELLLRHQANNEQNGKLPRTYAETNAESAAKADETSDLVNSHAEGGNGCQPEADTAEKITELHKAQTVAPFVDNAKQDEYAAQSSEELHEKRPDATENDTDEQNRLEELKGLLKSDGAHSRRYGKEDTSGYRFAWDDLPKISFDDVAGLADVKEAVMRKVLLPLKNPELYEGYVKKNGGGLLLYGPPGTGKTMIAAAIAHEIGAKFCSLGPSDLVLGGIGNSEKACVQLFKEARSFPCAVLFFDEIESICPVNTHAQGARQLRSELLRQIQGMEAYGEQNDKILFLIAATNKPWDVDPAFVRPGRFGTRIYVGLPDAPARRYMLEKRIGKIMQTGKVMIGDVNTDYIVERTEGFNGADMTNLLDEVQELSALRSAKTGIKEILQQDFDNALKKVTSSVQQKDMQKLLEWKEQNG